MEQKIDRISDLDLKSESRTIIISKSGSGKTVLLKEIIYYMLNKYDFHTIILMSETAHYESEYKFIPKKNIMPYSESKLKKLMDYQEKNIKKKQKLLLILDDMCPSNKKNFEQITKVFVMGRHLHITCICSFQYCSSTLLNPKLRANASYYFISDVNIETMRKLSEVIVVPGMSNKEFYNFISNNNQNYQFIFYDNFTRNKERLKVVKANMIEFKLLP